MSQRLVACKPAEVAVGSDQSNSLPVASFVLGPPQDKDALVRGERACRLPLEVEVLREVLSKQSSEHVHVKGELLRYEKADVRSTAEHAHHDVILTPDPGGQYRLACLGTKSSNYIVWPCQRIVQHAGREVQTRHAYRLLPKQQIATAAKLFVLHSRALRASAVRRACTSSTFTTSQPARDQVGRPVAARPGLQACFNCYRGFQSSSAQLTALVYSVSMPFTDPPEDCFSKPRLEATLLGAIPRHNLWYFSIKLGR